MLTKIFSLQNIDEAAELIVKWELIAFPTETVYGLWANALDSQAAEKIYTAKGRPSDNPLIVHIAHFRDIDAIASIPADKRASIEKLATRFWPGPLTLILPKKEVIPLSVSGGLDTVALRIPNHQTTLKLIRKAGVPIAGPSANISGKPSSTRFSHVFHDFDGKIAGIIRGWSAEFGIESSVIDMSGEIPLLLRPGAINLETLREVLPEISEYIPGKNTIARAPGMKYTHYAPKAKVYLFEEGAKHILWKYKENFESQGKKVRVILPENISHFGKHLFHILRESDLKNYDILLISAVSEVWVGKAIMNRLRKAASEIISS